MQILHAVKPPGAPLRTLAPRRTRHRRQCVAPQATSAFGVKVLEGPDDDPGIQQDASEFAGIEIVRPDAEGNVPEDDVGFAGIEIMREEPSSEPQLDVAFAGIEILRAPADAPVVEQSDSEILGVEVVRNTADNTLTPLEFAGVEIVREDGTPLSMEDGVVGIQIVRALSDEEASSDDEDDGEDGFTIEIVRDKPLPYPESLYLPPEQPRASWREAEHATMTAIAETPAPEQVPVPLEVKTLREGAPGPSWRPVFAALVHNQVVEDRVQVRAGAGSPEVAAAAAGVQAVVQAAAKTAAENNQDIVVGQEMEGDLGIEIVRDADHASLDTQLDDNDEGILGIEIVRDSDNAASDQEEGILGIEIVRDSDSAASDQEQEEGILGIEIVRDSDNAASEQEEGILGIEIVREGSQDLPLLDDLPEGMVIQVVGEEDSEVMRSFEDDDDEEFGTIWTGIEIVRDTPLPYSSKLYEPKPQPRVSLRAAWDAAAAQTPMVAPGGAAPRLKARSPAVTRNWSALFSNLVEGADVPLPEEEEEDTTPTAVVTSSTSTAAPAAPAAAHNANAHDDDEEGASTFLGIEIVREAAPAPAAAPTTTVTMERLPDNATVTEQVLESNSSAAFPRREERILKDSAMLGIEIVRESSIDEEDGITKEEEDVGGFEITRTPAGSTVLLGDGVEVPSSSLAAAYGLQAAEPQVDPRSSVYDGIEIVRQEVPAPSNTLGVVSYEGIEIMRAAEQPAEDPLVDEEFAGIEIVRTELPIQPAADAVEEEYDVFTIVREGPHYVPATPIEGVSVSPSGYAPPQPAQPHPSTPPRVPSHAPPRPPITRPEPEGEVEVDLDFVLDPALDLNTAPMGLHIYPSGEATFRVWAPHAQSVRIELAELPDFELPLSRGKKDIFQARFPAGLFEHGDAYQLHLRPMRKTPSAATPNAPEPVVPWPTVGQSAGSAVNGFLASLGTTVEAMPAAKIEGNTSIDESVEEVVRRDPYARWVDPNSEWCFVDMHDTYPWVTLWERPPADSYIIYEMHVGSFTEEGTFAAAEARLEHVAAMGFSAVQLLPVNESTDKWGYSPKNLMAPHPAYGTPDQLRAFVDTAHDLGLAVMVDLTLHHGGAADNVLWNFDGWSAEENGGIFHENAVDCPGGRKWAFWKGEVYDMLHTTCAVWVGDYRIDGIRIDAALEIPTDVLQRITHSMRETFPSVLLTASAGTEDPGVLHEHGFDALWCASGWFDMVRQHRALGRNPPNGQPVWDTGALKAALGIHEGFSKPSQMVKYLLGSHDQVGCQNNGGFYEEFKEIGGQKRYPVEIMAGGRGDPHNLAAQRAWYAGMVGGGGLPLLFQGCEVVQTGWWDNDGHHGLQWSLAEDDTGRAMIKAVADINLVRCENAALRGGWFNVLHEDPVNGVVAFERCLEGSPRMVVVVNAGKGEWTGGEYGIWVGGGQFEEVMCTQDMQYSQNFRIANNFSRGRLRASDDGRLYLNLPATCTLMLRQVPDGAPENTLPPAATPTIPHHIRAINPNGTMATQTPTGGAFD